MISATYVVAAVLAGLAALLAGDSLGLWGYIGMLCAAFFVASAAASAGYLTVSETFPLEIRAMAIALFYAISTGIGGAVGPLLFGNLLGGDDPRGVAIGYWIAAGLMALRRERELTFGVDAEQQSLEDVAEPLSAQGARRPRREARARPAGKDVGDQLVYAFLQRAPAVEQVLGEIAHVAERLAASSSDVAKTRVRRRREREPARPAGAARPSSASVCTTRPQASCVRWP